jgi:hypothetical protein
VNQRTGSELSYLTAGWSEEGSAALTAWGNDHGSALAAGLRAVLALVNPEAAASGSETRSVPIHGEGDDLASLFADLVDDLLAQWAEFGPSLHDVVIDGLLRREGGGFVAWGYAEGSLQTAPLSSLPHLESTPTVTETSEGEILIHATLRRS